MKPLQNKVAIAVAAASLILGACSKKAAAVHPPAAPTPSATSEPQRQTSEPTRTAETRRTTETPAENASKYPDAATRRRIDELLAKIEDAYFDYNKAVLRPDAVKALENDSTELRDILKDYPDYKLTVEGHCDERGSEEYNLALGDRRADSAKEYLVQVGIPAGQLKVVSYGKDRPVCQDHDEACWQKNRRIHIVAMAQ